MGHLRAPVALLAAGLVCMAMAATASAREGGTHQFVGNATSEVTLFTGEQELDFDPLVIHCNGVKPVRTHTKTVFPVLKIRVDAKLIKCKSVTVKADGEVFPASKVSLSAPFELEYQAGGEPDATIANTAPVQITFAGLMAGCTISVSPNRPTDEVTYTDEEIKAKNTKSFPTGVQDVIAIDNSFQRLTYTVGGGLCEAIHRTSGNGGEWFGSLVTGLKTGDLTWE